MRKIILFTFIYIFLSVSSSINAQTLHNDLQGEWKGEVKKILLEEKRNVPGTNTDTWYQELEVELLEGSKKGENVQIVNDLYKLKTGDRLFINYLITAEGDEFFHAGEPDRSNVILLFIAIFLGVVLLFGKKSGIRSILSLVLSFVVIIFLMLPALLKGFPPVPTIVILSSLILGIAMYTTHGWNKITHSAFLGTVSTTVIVSLLAQLGVKMGQLSGFASDEAVYLNLNSGGTLNIEGLLLGSMIIGALGILDDIAITQGSVVREIFKTDQSLTKTEVYRKAIRVGREHVGALVNTLALAYTGASLPLLLLFYQSSMPVLNIINREIFATEIIRTISGSIGLILAVPISTLISVHLLYKYKGGDSEKVHHHHHH